MTTASAIYFNGLSFLDELESTFNMNGLEGVIRLVQDSFPIGRRIRMKEEINDSAESFYEIEKVSVIDVSGKILWIDGDSSSESIIRSIQLPYVSMPFGIIVYGSLSS